MTEDKDLPLLAVVLLIKLVADSNWLVDDAFLLNFLPGKILKMKTKVFKFSLRSPVAKGGSKDSKETL